MIDFPVPVSSVTLDLDGTLLDTVADISVAVNAMLRELELPQRSEDEIRDFLGKGVPSLIERCLNFASAPSEEILFHTVEIFRKHYRVSNGISSKPYPGVIDGLLAFRRMGLKMAVITNKPAMFTEPLLISTGLMPYFEFSVSGDSLPEKKPHPLPLLHACKQLGSRPHYNLHIGDSSNDALAARAAGCRIFCVPYGYNEGESVLKIDCDAIVSSIEEAATLITRFNELT